MIRVALVDDHMLAREGIRTLLGRDPEIVVVGEAADGARALELIAREAPDVVVLDLQVPGVSGAELCSRIAQGSFQSSSPGSAQGSSPGSSQGGSQGGSPGNSPGVHKSMVLILTAYLNPQLLRQCVAAGARGYLMKDTESLDVVAAVRTVASGGTVFDRRATGLEHEILNSGYRHFENLTPKELQVLGLLSKGMSNSEIGARLAITPNTIKTHVKTIMRKLDCRNRVEVVVRARELNLV